MKSRFLTWVLLMVLVLILGGITTGLTSLLMEYDRQEHHRKHLDQTDNLDRKVLWHLESHLGQFITTENARPYEDYLNHDSGSAFVFDSEVVACYFHVEPGKTLTHPEQPEPHLLELISLFQPNVPSVEGESNELLAQNMATPSKNVTSKVLSEKVQKKEQVLQKQAILNQQLESQVRDPNQIIRRLKSDRAQDYLYRSQAAENAYQKKTRRSNIWNNFNSSIASYEQEEVEMEDTLMDSSVSSLAKLKSDVRGDAFLSGDIPPRSGKETSTLEPGSRGSFTLTQSMASKDTQGAVTFSAPPAPIIQEGVLKPYMLDKLLMLRRKVQHDGEEHHQGLLIPWDRLQQWALNKTKDLGRSFSLQPSSRIDNYPSAYQLAMVPALLVTEALPSPAYRPSLILKWVLMAFWASMGIAVLILTFLFLGILKLSKRRGMFASAVTHELRTPLTTFSMYTEMLDEGMVQDPAKQKQYLSVLRRESDRLSHLVENVLAFSRLEQRKLNLVRDAVPLSDFIETILARGIELTRQKGHPLKLDQPEDLTQWITRCDSDHAGQIVFNMIENAHKYGCPQSDSPIEIRLVLKKKKLLLTVRDHGPGVSPTFRRRLFKPFSKSDRDAADTSHGVGLGLALCRSLARQLGGNLRYLKATEGASFELSLPIEKN